MANAQSKPPRAVRARKAKSIMSGKVLKPGSPAAIAVQEAREAGLLEGEGTRHVSFRAPTALVEAALREAGVSSTTELGISALALMAQPDPAASFMKRTRGRLGADHTLEY